MGQQPCAGGSPWGSSQDSSEGEEEDSDLGATAHSREVREIVALLAEKHDWNVSPEVEECIANTDLPAYREILKRGHQPEPGWDEKVHGAFLDDKRVRHLATGGCVFEKLSVYVVLVQLLYPAIARGHAPRVLDVGCGTGFLTSVLARLVAPRGGSVVAIDMFSRQIQNAQQTMASTCPELLPHVDFQVANGWDYRDPRGTNFTAIAVAAQAAEVPEGLVKQLAPNGRLVLPLGGQSSTDRIQRKVYRKYWMIEKGMDGAIGFSGRSGPINVNFVPFLPPVPPPAATLQAQQGFNVPKPDDLLPRVTANLDYFAVNYVICLALFFLVAIVVYPQLLVMVCVFSGLWYALLTRPPHIQMKIGTQIVTKRHMMGGLGIFNVLVVFVFARTTVFATIGASFLFVLLHAGFHSVPSKAKDKASQEGDPEA